MKTVIASTKMGSQRRVWGKRGTEREGGSKGERDGGKKEGRRDGGTEGGRRVREKLCKLCFLKAFRIFNSHTLVSESTFSCYVERREPFLGCICRLVAM